MIAFTITFICIHDNIHHHIHNRIHNHIHHDIHNCIHIHFRYQLVTNSLPTCYQSLNMILSYLCRPALKARSRFSWSPFYVEIILIIWLYPLHFMAYLVREVLEPSIAPFRPSIQFVRLRGYGSVVASTD